MAILVKYNPFIYTSFRGFLMTLIFLLRIISDVQRFHGYWLNSWVSYPMLPLPSPLCATTWTSNLGKELWSLAVVLFIEIWYRMNLLFHTGQHVSTKSHFSLLWKPDWNINTAWQKWWAPPFCATFAHTFVLECCEGARCEKTVYMICCQGSWNCSLAVA